MKKIIIPVIALLVLFTVTPVMTAPATKISFTGWGSFGFGNVSPGEVWITDDGVSHVKGAVSQGEVTIQSVLGPMKMEIIMVHDLALDSNTGLGDCHGKFILGYFDEVSILDGVPIIEGLRLFEGTEHGSHIITNDGHYISGGLQAKGIGDFKGVKMQSSYEGEITEGEVVDIDLDGTLLAPHPLPGM